MAPVIHVLNPHAANQIAAGEVVERPVSVIKELVENALDAGARRIDIAVEGNGVPLMRVRDDGLGIQADDLTRAVLRHATSKIREIEDLNTLTTLGFRGEALPSIASVARLEILSRPPEESVGHILRLEGGTALKLEEAGCPVGTTVTVENLFFNTPARLKFLRSNNTEFGLISDTVGRLALARPDVAFSLSHPRQAIFQTPGRGKPLESIAAMLGANLARRLLPVSFAREGWLLAGYISPPDLVRSNRQTLTFIVNGRYIRSPLLTRALLDGYHTLIPAKLYPIAILHLHLPPGEYDVNVHPTKMDVKFVREQELAQFIAEGIREALLSKSPLPSLGAEKHPRMGMGIPLENTGDESGHIAEKTSTYWEKERGYRENPGAALEVMKALKNLDSPMISGEGEGEGEGEGATNGVLGPVEAPNDSVPTWKQSLISSDTLGLWPLAQVFSTYILATDGKVLVVIDQHAAHERINYEAFLRETKERETQSQALLIPIPFELTLQEEQIVLEYLWALDKLGFVLEQFGAQTYLLRAVPVQAAPLSAEELLRQFIDTILSTQTAPSFDQLLEEWIYRLACKASLKAQESLSLLEMEQLLNRLAKTENPYTCPHGRPTMIQLSKNELERRFYRI